MKKIVLLLSLVIFTGSIFAAQTTSSEYPRIKLSTKNYELKFSNCNTNSLTCMNEYYRLKEKGWDWTELVTVHYLGKQKDVMTYAKKLQRISPYSGDILYNKAKDTALVSFMIPYKDKKNRKGAIEQNIFRIENAPDGKGLVAIQYACRHPFNTDEERENTKIAAKKVQDKYIQIIANVEIPALVLKSFQNW